MRVFILLATLFLGLELYGQTDSIEKAILYNKLQLKEITNLEFNDIGKQWNETIKNSKYPELPVSSNGEIQYSYIIDFKEINKEKLFNRTLEWLSITYGLVPAYLYSNLKDGKIICSNNLDIYDNTSGSFTYVISIKDEKLLLEFTNIGYQVTTQGYYVGDTWKPEKNDFYTFDKVFPIILKSSKKWPYYFGIVKKVNTHINKDINSLNDYILNYDLRYQF